MVNRNVLGRYASGLVTFILLMMLGTQVQGAVPIGTYAGTDIWTNGSYRYGPSIIIEPGGQTIHIWAASEGSGGVWDYIRYRKSTNGGSTWSTEQTVLTPTSGSVDALSVCDPGVFKYGSYYYCGYTSTTASDGTNNNVFVARSTSPTGPWSKWNGSGWGGNPAPFIVYGGASGYFGCGEPSFVVKDGTIYIYYTYMSDTANETRVATVSASNANWPGALTYRGTALTRGSGEASTDIKYIDTLDRWIGIAERNRLTASSYIIFYESADGISFSQTGATSDNIAAYCHNSGISGRADGHLNLDDKNFIAYAYGPNWGQWDMRRNYITFNDLFVLAKSSTGSGMTEVHSLGTLGGFQTWTRHYATGQGPTDSNHPLRIHDWNADTKMDLFVIQRVGGSNKTEVHIWSGADYTSPLAHIATGLHVTDANWDFDLGFWDSDAIPDLFCIKRIGTTMTEVHILSGSSNYQTFIGQYSTALPITNTNTSFAVADWNNDGTTDLFAINRVGSTATEVRILSGASGFGTVLGTYSTALGITDSSWSFDVGDWNGDTYPDVVGIHRDASTGTEVHILNGAGNFANYLVNSTTANGSVGDNFEFVVNFINK